MKNEETYGELVNYIGSLIAFYENSKRRPQSCIRELLRTVVNNLNAIADNGDLLYWTPARPSGVMKIKSFSNDACILTICEIRFFIDDDGRYNFKVEWK